MKRFSHRSSLCDTEDVWASAHRATCWCYWPLGDAGDHVRQTQGPYCGNPSQTYWWSPPVGLVQSDNVVHGWVPLGSAIMALEKDAYPFLQNPLFFQNEWIKKDKKWYSASFRLVFWHLGFFDRKRKRYESIISIINNLLLCITFHSLLWYTHFTFKVLLIITQLWTMNRNHFLFFLFFFVFVVFCDGITSYQ